jgi:hypothetical protein
MGKIPELQHGTFKVESNRQNIAKILPRTYGTEKLASHVSKKQDVKNCTMKARREGRSFVWNLGQEYHMAKGSTYPTNGKTTFGARK